jgi:hypothetical protein
MVSWFVLEIYDIMVYAGNILYHGLYWKYMISWFMLEIYDIMVYIEKYMIWFMLEIYDIMVYIGNI